MLTKRQEYFFMIDVACSGIRPFFGVKGFECPGGDERPAVYRGLHLANLKVAETVARLKTIRSRMRRLARCTPGCYASPERFMRAVTL